MRGRQSTIPAKRVGTHRDGVRVCQRCGIERSKDSRKGSICMDCRQADPEWGKR